MNAMIVKSVSVTSSASVAPTPADGSVERIVSGMHEAFVEDAEHDVDGDDGRQDQPGLVLERLLEYLCGALEPALNRRRHADVAGRALDRDARRRRATRPASG